MKMIAELLFMGLLVICGRMEERVKYCFLLPQSVFRVIHQEFEKTVVRMGWKVLFLFDNASNCK